MSEFSNSFHLRSNDVRDGVELLQRARVQGFVFRPANGWVPLVFPHGVGMGDKLERVVAANRHLAVHYDYAEDHGVAVDAYQGPTRIAELAVSFESERATFEMAKFIDAGLMSSPSAHEIKQWIDGGRDRGLLVVAAALGLPRHAWFSYDSIAQTPSSTDRIEVSRNGVVVEEDDEVTDAPVDETALGPLVHVTAQLIRTLVADESLVLADDADVEEIAEALVAVLSNHDGARPESALLDCLTEHPMVDEVFADEPTIAAALRSAMT